MNRNTRRYDPAKAVVWLVLIPLFIVAFWGSVAALVARASEPETSSSRMVQVPGDARVPAYIRTPCPYQDSVNCYWNAATRGNGLGHSYYAIRVGRSGVLVRYWNRSYGKTHDRYLPDGW